MAADEAVGRLVWGWVQEAATRTYDDMMFQGWAGVMSLPRTVTLEYVLTYYEYVRIVIHSKSAYGNMERRSFGLMLSGILVNETCSSNERHYSNTTNNSNNTIPLLL